MAHHGSVWKPPQSWRHLNRLYWLLAGILALAWLLLRSGPKPSRLAYPCQQAAFSTAALVFGATVVAGVVALRRRLSARWLTPAGLLLGSVGLIAAAGTWGYLQRSAAYEGPLPDPPRDYRAQVFSQQNCPKNPVGDRFICVEDLIEKMGAQGLKFYRSAGNSLTAGPAGILAADDVILLKINYQWAERGGTNTEVLRGLIRRIVEHPDSFTGEIVIIENTQFASPENYDRPLNNAEDQGLSPRDVVNHFLALGHKISIVDLTAIRYNSVDEYGAGDMTSGYVVYDYDAALHGKISYPKFQTTYGTRISLRDGVWTFGVGYDRDRLKFINLPVLKSHHATYGATAMVKNYMGVVTRELSTNSHGSIGYGILGALMGEIRPADLNIMDAIWINADPYDGPWTGYGDATRRDRLVASLDPVAADLWAVKNILIPTFIENGFSPPWPYPSADPDNPGSEFREYLDRSMNYMLNAGYEVTNDLGQIDIIAQGPPGEASDPSGSRSPLTIARLDDGYELDWSSPFRGAFPVDYVLYRVSLPGGTAAECEADLGGGFTVVLDTLPDDHGFFVVARNGVGEGSLGRNSSGRDRPGPAHGSVCP